MDDKSKQLKMQLLEKLMSEMDDSVVSRLKEPDMVVEVEAEGEMPSGELEDVLKDKMSDCEEDDDMGDSRLMQRLKEMRSKKSME